MTSQGIENLGFWHKKAGNASLGAPTKCLHHGLEHLLVQRDPRPQAPLGRALYNNRPLRVPGWRSGDMGGARLERSTSSKEPGGQGLGPLRERPQALHFYPRAFEPALSSAWSLPGCLPLAMLASAPERHPWAPGRPLYQSPPHSYCYQKFVLLTCVSLIPVCPPQQITALGGRDPHDLAHHRRLERAVQAS